MSITKCIIKVDEVKKLQAKRQRDLAKKASVRVTNPFANFSMEQREFILESMFDLNLEEFLVLYLRYWREFSIEDISTLLSLKTTKISELVDEGVATLSKMYNKSFLQWRKNLKARMLQA